MKILCVLKSEESYKRIRISVNEAAIEWEYEVAFELIRNSAASVEYDLVIVDNNIIIYEQVIELFERLNIKIVTFRGDYEDVVASVKQKYKFYLESDQYVPVRKDESKGDYIFQDGQPVKVIYKEVVKQQRVEIPVIQKYGSASIAVINLSSRAGSTFVSTNLARAVARQDMPVTLVESPLSKEPYYYHHFDLYQTEEGVYSPYNEILNENKIEDFMLEERFGVKFAIQAPNSSVYKEWKSEHSLQLLYQLSKEIAIYDIGYNYSDPAAFEIVKNANVILLIIDPTPSDVLINKDRLIELYNLMHDKNLPIHYVYNRWDKGIDEKDFTEGIGEMPITKIKNIGREYIYKSLYAQKSIEFVVDNVEDEEFFDNLFPILKLFIPDEKLSKRQFKKKKFFSFRS